MINLFEPSPSNKTINLIKNIFKKKYFYKDTYCEIFLEKFSKFRNLKKKKYSSRRFLLRLDIQHYVYF